MNEGERSSCGKFHALDSDKRERIIGAAMKEFLAGFKRASTDNIVREAGISKGLLFHYFGTKEGLYRYLVEYSVKTLHEEFLNLLNVNQPDILDTIWQMSLLKRDISVKFPAIFDFLTNAYLDTDAKTSITKEVLEKTFSKRNEILRQINENADFTLFRDDICPVKAIKIINWAMDGFAMTTVGEANAANPQELPAEAIRENYDKYLDEFKEYLSILRLCFYKPQQEGG